MKSRLRFVSDWHHGILVAHFRNNLTLSIYISCAHVDIVSSVSTRSPFEDLQIFLFRKTDPKRHRVSKEDEMCSSPAFQWHGSQLPLQSQVTGTLSDKPLALPFCSEFWEGTNQSCRDCIDGKDEVCVCTHPHYILKRARCCLWVPF